MAEIELVIKIDEEDYKIMRHNIAVNNPLCPLSQEEMVSKVAKGTPLPKGHGRLIDADAYKEKVFRKFPCNNRDDSNIRRLTEIAISNAPTIVEADGGDENECHY